MHKLHTHVTFPVDLSMAPFRSQGSSGASLYTLRSVVSHHGHQMSGGHFTTYGRAAVCDTELWLHFNDARVTQVSPTEVAAAQAYILLYERKDPA
jgi:uncharacterized UBP type Zn finger protein